MMRNSVKLVYFTMLLTDEDWVSKVPSKKIFYGNDSH